MLRLMGAHIATNVRAAAGIDVEPGLHKGKRGRIGVSSGCEIGPGCVLHAYGGEIFFGERVHIGPYCAFYGHGGIRIGAHTMLAMGCKVVSSNHTIPKRGELIRAHPNEPLPVLIDEDVWIGAGAIILGGVTIGKGAVVAAGAVVSRDIPDYSIARGVPARVVGKRSE